MLTGLLASLFLLGQTATIRVLVVGYYPLDGSNIDRKVTGDVGGAYEDLKRKTALLTTECCRALEKGATFRGYKNPTARPALKYEVVGEIEFKEALPVMRTRPDEKAPLTDYDAIMRRVDVRDWVERRRVQEIWIWGYHGGVVNLWESNMSSPFGDVSNSNRDEVDLPVFNRTYTVYH